MRDVRHRAVWPTMGLCVLLLAVYLYLGARECRSSSGARRATAVTVEDDDDDDNVDVRGKRRRCCGRRGGRCLRLVTFLLAFLVWMTAAGSVTLSGTLCCMCSPVFLVFGGACVNMCVFGGFKYRMPHGGGGRWLFRPRSFSSALWCNTYADGVDTGFEANFGQI